MTRTSSPRSEHATDDPSTGSLLTTQDQHQDQDQVKMQSQLISVLIAPWPSEARSAHRPPLTENRPLCSSALLGSTVHTKPPPPIHPGRNSLLLTPTFRPQSILHGAREVDTTTTVMGSQQMYARNGLGLAPRQWAGLTALGHRTKAAGSWRLDIHICCIDTHTDSCGIYLGASWVQSAGCNASSRNDQ